MAATPKKGLKIRRENLYCGRATAGLPCQGGAFVGEVGVERGRREAAIMRRLKLNGYYWEVIRAG